MFAEIAAGVLTVKVVVCVGPALVRELEAKLKNPPIGGAGQVGDAVVIAVRSTVQEVGLPLKETETKYVDEEPARIGTGV